MIKNGTYSRILIKQKIKINFNRTSRKTKSVEHTNFKKAFIYGYKDNKFCTYLGFDNQYEDGSCSSNLTFRYKPISPLDVNPYATKLFISAKKQ